MIRRRARTRPPGEDGDRNRGNGVPDWAPPAEVCDLIHDGAGHDELGEVGARAAEKGEEP